MAKPRQNKAPLDKGRGIVKAKKGQSKGCKDDTNGLRQ